LSENSLPKLWEHQLLAISKMVERDSYALFLDPGLGKSRCVIEALTYRYQKAGRILNTLILAPLVVTNNWKDEFKKFSKINPSDVVVLSGSGTKKCDTISRAMGSNKVFVLNYDSLINVEVMEELLTWGVEVVVADESQRIKNPTAKRTKAAVKISRQAKCRYILTGTPVSNSMMDIFSQMLFLDHGKLFGDRFMMFKLKYFYDKNSWMPRHTHFPNGVFRKGTGGGFKARVVSISMTAKKEECLDLPPLVFVDIPFDMAPDQKKAYQSMEKEYVAFVSSELCYVDLAITRGLRLQQVATGYLQLDNGELHTFKENPRADALEDLLEDLTPNHKVIVWACFKENYKTIRGICEKLKVKYVEIHGEIGQVDRVAAMQSFETEASCRVCICNAVSSGVGINLIAASYSIVYSRNFSLESEIQSLARNYRGGSEIHQKITRIDLVATGTIDELIKEALREKKSIGDALITHYKQLVK